MRALTLFLFCNIGLLSHAIGQSTQFHRDPERILQQAFTVYQECASYQDRGAVRILTFTHHGDAQHTASSETIKLFTTHYQPLQRLHYKVTDKNTEPHYTSLIWYQSGEHRTSIRQNAPEEQTPEQFAALLQSNQTAFGQKLNPVISALISKQFPFAPSSQASTSLLLEGEEKVGSDLTYKLTFSTFTQTPTLHTLWFRKKDLALVKALWERETPEHYQQITTLFMPVLNAKIAPHLFDFEAPEPIYFEVATSYLNFGPAKRSAQFVSMRDLLERPTPTPAPTSPQNKTATTEAAPSPQPTTEETKESNPFAEYEEFTENAEDTQATAEAPAPLPELNPKVVEALLVLEGKTKRGSAFSCQIKGRPFIVTSLYALSNNRDFKLFTAEGDKVPPGQLFAAKGQDIAILQAVTPRGNVSLLESQAEPLPNEEIIIPASVYSAPGSIRTVGKITQVTDKYLEIEADVVPENLGSPVFNRETGQLLGVLTQAKDKMLKVFIQSNPFAKKKSYLSRKTPKRWYVARLEAVQQWNTIKLPQWYEQADFIKRFEKDTLDLYRFLEPNSNTFWKNAQLSELVADYRKDINARKHPSNVQERITRSFIQKIVSFAERDLKQIETTPFYDYFKTTRYANESITAQKTERIKAIQKVEELGLNWRNIKERFTSK